MSIRPLRTGIQRLATSAFSNFVPKEFRFHHSDFHAQIWASDRTVILQYVALVNQNSPFSNWFQNNWINILWAMINGKPFYK